MYRHEHEPSSCNRDVEAIMVPAGIPVTLREGKTGFITQALGGSFTVYVEGNLFRIAGKDAERSARKRCSGPSCRPDATDDDVQAAGVGPDAHLLRPGDPDQHRRPRPGVRVRSDARTETATRNVEIKMTLTAPGCGMGEVLVQDVKDKVEVIPTVKRADVELVFDPPWNQTMMSEAARLQTGMM